jgi:hypothetical protein
MRCIIQVTQLTVEGNFMDKAQRKRRAVIGAIALLNWRNMTREDAVSEMMQARYDLMLAEMRRQAEDAAQRRRWRSVVVREDFPLPAVSHASHYS